MHVIVNLLYSSIYFLAHDYASAAAANLTLAVYATIEAYPSSCIKQSVSFGPRPSCYLLQPISENVSRFTAASAVV